ncbi:MAG TPA: TIR domain-containing protein [Steroidobacteraceae bacterium]|nr:TIR domain-containing protein [Steroidobacteraceae bacterium]
MTTEAKKAVFISYASDDREAALKICESLRNAGVEVWFDQSELRGGDAWDASIRKQIKNCTLFLAIISRSTRARQEGYFRLEWKLAVDRSHLMSQERAFLLPVAIDDTPEDSDNLPDRFKEVQWVRLLGGSVPDSFVDRVNRLLAVPQAAPGQIPALAPPASATGARPSGSKRRTLLLGAGAFTLAVLAAIGVRHYLNARAGAAPESAIAANPPSAPAKVAGFIPPEHSIAVMPFANMSGDPAQEYFSDGLSEELLDALSRLPGLHVAARTSSFSFKGKSTTVADIARTLNVAALLEGSVRREGTKVRISAQLISAVTGFELWSQTYDRDLKDVLKLQSDVAAAVIQSLRVKLIDDLPALVEAGGTHDPRALDLFFRARALNGHQSQQNLNQTVELTTQAIRLDPQYADAYAERGNAESNLAGGWDPQERIARRYAEARRDIERAIELAPQNGKSRAQYGTVLQNGYLDFRGAQVQFAKAEELSPNEVAAMASVANFQALMGRSAEATTTIRRALALNPLSPGAWGNSATAFLYIGLYEESIKAADHVASLGSHAAEEIRCEALLLLGRTEEALAACQPADDATKQASLAVLFNKLNRQSEAQAMLDRLVKENADAAAYQYAGIYAQWGDVKTALKWIERAYEVKDPGLAFMKADPMLEPIRREPRFQAVVRKLNFPD